MSYFDRQGIPEEVLKVQPQEEEIQDLMKQKGGGARDDEKDEDKDIEDDNSSEASGDDMFEDAVDRLRSYSLCRSERTAGHSKCTDWYS
jgi:hypothetical protein